MTYQSNLHPGHTYEAGVADEKVRRWQQSRNHGTRTVRQVLDDVRNWNEKHNPWDYTSRLPLFQFVIEEGTGGALVPLSESTRKEVPAIYLGDHARKQFFNRVDYADKLYNRLPERLNLLNLNWLVQNGGDLETMFRMTDQNQARAMLSGRFQPFDNLELLEMIEPFAGHGLVRWEWDDEMTFHLSISFPNTVQFIKEGDAVEQGIHISNSEVGLRSVTVAAYVYRLKCFNGLIGGGNGDIYRFRHTGGGNGNGHEKMRDMVAAAIESCNVESQRIKAEFQASLEKEIDQPFHFLETQLKHDLTQDEFKAVLDQLLLNQDDAGTLFGCVNAVTRTAQDLSGERSYELQRIGARMLQS